MAPEDQKYTVRTKRIGIGAAVCLIGISALIYAYNSSARRFAPENYGLRILQDCQNAPYRPSCYENKIAGLSLHLAMDDSFAVMRFIQAKDPEYTYCHSLAHKISEAEVRKDSGSWQDVLARCPLTECSKGCIHGAFQERFQAESLPNASAHELAKEFDGICEGTVWTSRKEEPSCYHALGHLLLYVTEADIKKSSDVCAFLSKSARKPGMLEICLTGVFMQFFQAQDPDEIALVAGKQPTKEGLGSFCSQFSGLYGEICWRNGWPLFLEQVKEPAGLVTFCEQAGPEFKDVCYKEMFYMLGTWFNFDVAKVANFCSGLPEERIFSCFGNGAARFAEVDLALLPKGIDLCNFAGERASRESCYAEIVSFLKFMVKDNAEDLIRLCEQFPGSWIQECTGRVGTNI